MSDKEPPMRAPLVEEPPLDENERAEAEALRRLLEGDGDERTAGLPASAEHRAAIGLLQQDARKVAPLGEVRARGLARAAIVEARRRTAGRTARFRRRVIAAGALAACLALTLFVQHVVRRPAPLPERLCSRSGDLVVPGPFPAAQTAAERLDLITEDRLLAFRELHFRALSQGRR